MKIEIKNDQSSFNLFSLHLHYLYVSNKSLPGFLQQQTQWLNLHCQFKLLFVSFQCFVSVTSLAACLQHVFWRKTDRFLSPAKIQAWLHS